MIKVVAFDVDGTLYDIKQLNKCFVKLYLRHPIRTRLFFKARKSVRVLLENDERECITREEFLHYQTLSVGKKDGYFDVIYTTMRKVRHLTPYKNVEKLLVLLKEKGICLAVLSDFPIETKVDELGLSSYFDVMLSAEDCGFLKPNKKAFSYLLSHLDAKAEECIYIGDSRRKDKDGAANSGLKGLLLGEDFTDYEDLIRKINILLK